MVDITIKVDDDALKRIDTVMVQKALQESIRRYGLESRSKFFRRHGLRGILMGPIW